MKKFAILALVLAATACSSTKASDTPNGAASGDGGGGTGSSGGDPANPDDPGKTTGPIRMGTVSLTQSKFTAGPTTINSYSASAFFIESSSGAVDTTATGSASCTKSTDGDCAISECTIAKATGDAGTPVDAGAPTSAKAPTAGEVTVAGTTSITLAPDGNGAYTPKSGQEELFAPDADIAIKAKGAEVPAFDKSLKAPSAVTITQPAWPAAGQPFQLDRTKEIALVWTGGVSGDVTANISSITTDKVTNIVCKFPASANKGTISAAALGKLVVTTTGSISVSASSTLTFEDGDWKISATATSPAKAGTSMASGSATIK